MALAAALPTTQILVCQCTSSGKDVADWLAREHGRPSAESACDSAAPAAELEIVFDASSSASSSSCCSSSSLSASASSGSLLSKSLLSGEDRASSDAASSLSSLAFCQRDSHTCTTSDGWSLHLEHAYDPTAEAAGWPPRAQHPVLMVPGLASSGEHTFDLLPECSLVNALVARGYDVWVADLRGNGCSQKPSMFDAATWWTVDDHFHKDVPAVLEYVLAHTGAKQVHWIGHSMGGMLAVGLLSQQGKLASALRSITLLASGCFGRGSWHSALRPLIERITCYGFPAGLVCGAIGALAGSTAALWPLEALFYWPSNTPLAAARRLMSGCFRFIPVGVIRQFMGSLNSEMGLSSADGSFRYADPRALAGAQVPVLAINGSWDLFCPSDGGRKTLELLGSSCKQFVCLGPRNGTRRHYGHFDLLCGRHAPREVFPYVTGWLQQHDAPLQR